MSHCNDPSVTASLRENSSVHSVGPAGSVLVVVDVVVDVVVVVPNTPPQSTFAGTTSGNGVIVAYDVSVASTTVTVKSVRCGAFAVVKLQTSRSRGPVKPLGAIYATCSSPDGPESSSVKLGSAGATFVHDTESPLPVISSAERS